MADWRDSAACRGMGLSVFFPNSEKPDMYDRARAICAGCPVRRECLEDAATFESTHVTFGMRGGMVPRERNAWRDRNRQRRCECEECGAVFMAERASARFCTHACQQRDWYRRNREHVQVAKQIRQAS